MRNLAYILTLFVAVSASAQGYFGIDEGTDMGVVKNGFGGVTAAYMGHSGTNDTLEIASTNAVAIPYRISEVQAVTNGTATAVKLYRVENYWREYSVSEVETNFWGDTVTNTVPYGPANDFQTNLVYDSSSDTLPVAKWVMPNDIIIADFDSVTNVYFRLIGTAE